MVQDQIRVLVADDNYFYRQIVKEILSSTGDFVIAGEADNGEKLISNYFDLNPDLIITDISMPVMSGYQAFLEIKSRDNSVKAIFMTLHPEQAYYHAIIKEGGLGLINKLFIYDELSIALHGVKVNNFHCSE